MEVELWDVSNPSYPQFVKYLSDFYVYFPAYRIEYDEEGQLHFVKDKIPANSWKKMLDILSLNPCLKYSRTYEVRIYKLDGEFKVTELLVKWKFYTEDPPS